MNVIDSNSFVFVRTAKEKIKILHESNENNHQINK